jgi:hypothetical protein
VPHAGPQAGPPEGRRPRVPADDPAPWRAGDVVVWIALIVDTALAILDAVTPVVLINLLVFGPLVAAVRATPRTTAGVAAYALSLALYEGVPHGIFGTSDHLVRCAAIAATGALAVWGSWQRAAAIDKARLDAELRASEDAVRRSNAQLGAILGGVADGVIARNAAGGGSRSSAASPPRRASPRAPCCPRRGSARGARAGCARRRPRRSGAGAAARRRARGPHAP